MASFAGNERPFLPGGEEPRGHHVPTLLLQPAGPLPHSPRYRAEPRPPPPDYTDQYMIDLLIIVVQFVRLWSCDYNIL